MKQPSEMTDRELDLAVAVEVMGWPWLMDTFQTGPMRFLAKPDGNYGAAGPWNGDPMEILDTTDGFAPSTSIADAMKVVEKMRTIPHFGNVEMEWYPDEAADPWVVTIYRNLPAGDKFRADCATASRAICIAALSAIRAASKEQQEEGK